MDGLLVLEPGFKSLDPGAQFVIFLAGAGGHGVNHVILLAGDKIEIPDDFLDLGADKDLQFLTHALGGTGGVSYGFGQFIEQPVIGLGHGGTLAGSPMLGKAGQSCFNDPATRANRSLDRRALAVDKHGGHNEEETRLMILAILPYPEIDPVLIQIGPVMVRWYSLAYIAGLVLGWRYGVALINNKALWRAARAPISKQNMDDLFVWCAFGIILGGRLGYVLFYNLPFYLENPASILAVWQGGMSFHGGLLGVIIALWIYCRRHGKSLLGVIDIVAATVAIGLFFGRVANFINGELYGRLSDAPWAVVFPMGGGLARHPSQLYEAGLEGILLFLVIRYFTHKRQALHKPGLVLGIMALGYGLARIFVEFFREPDAHIGYLSGFVTMGMVLTVPMILVGLYFIFRHEPATS